MQHNNNVYRNVLKCGKINVLDGTFKSKALTQLKFRLLHRAAYSKYWLHVHRKRRL